MLMSIKTAFDNLDGDGSGTVDTAEMSTILRKMGVSFSADELAKWIKILDGDGDGQITFYEFLRVRCSVTICQ